MSIRNFSEWKIPKVIKMSVLAYQQWLVKAEIVTGVLNQGSQAPQKRGTQQWAIHLGGEKVGNVEFVVEKVMRSWLLEKSLLSSVASYPCTVEGK